jgi:branched-chain amino acid transport system substrate-binding protein
VVAVGASLLVASLALAGCGTRGESDSGDAAGSGSENKVAKIGVIAPLSGDLSALGKGIQHSVELAVKQANESKAIPGWTLEVVPVDDEAKPDIGKNGATKLAGDDDVVGVVGNLNSSVTQQTQPVFAAAKITQISPANTGPTLTMGAEATTAPKRQYPSFFRTCTTDLVQGKFAAKFLMDQDITKVATIHDKKTYGQGLVAAFTKNFTEMGGQIVAAETINADDANYSAAITKVKPSNPQVVYFGGEYPQGGPLSQQMKAAGLDVPMMGGDGIFDPTFIELATATSEGDFATSVGGPTDSSEAGKKFLADYEAAGFPEPAAAYGGYSYDAANAIINALKVSLKDADDAKSARDATIDEVGKVSFEGVTGQVEFDEFGDTKVKVITGYKVEGGKWATIKTEAVT